MTSKLHANLENGFKKATSRNIPRIQPSSVAHLFKLQVSLCLRNFEEENWRGKCLFIRVSESESESESL